MTDLASSSHLPEIRLHTDEQIVESGRARSLFVLAATMAPTLLASGAMILAWYPQTLKTAGFPLWKVGIMAGVVCVWAIGAWVVAKQRWHWHRWWLTDKRLVVRQGVIGYQLKSVPLDRIVDVTLKASWWDRLWGLQHIQVRDMTGEVGGYNNRSKGLEMLAVEGAEDIAHLVLVQCRA